MRPISQDDNRRRMRQSPRQSLGKETLAKSLRRLDGARVRGRSLNTQGKPLCIGARLREDASQLRLSGLGGTVSLLTPTTGSFSLGYRNTCSIIRNVQNRDRFTWRSNRSCHSLCPDTLFPALDVRPCRLGNPFHILGAKANP